MAVKYEENPQQLNMKKNNWRNEKIATTFSKISYIRSRHKKPHS